MRHRGARRRRRCRPTTRTRSCSRASLRAPGWLPRAPCPRGSPTSRWPRTRSARPCRWNHRSAGTC
ncbi:MAG: hypothetical protein EON52_19510 [Actinomycetales bacterium]|nr:MAG: hypothetical protein EON52_19510 [Actinomycetales bacterium]